MIEITESYFSWLPRRLPKPPRERYVTYYRDLYSLYGDSLSIETFFSGSQYSYAELGDSVLMQCEKNHALENIDFMLIANWSYEFDPDYASCSAYFSNKYQIKKMMMDVGDQGTMAFFTGINIVKDYIQSHQNSKAALLFLEQKTIPINKNSNVILPVYDAASLVFLKNHLEISGRKKFYELLSLGVIEENLVHSMSDIILDICYQHHIDLKALTVITKGNEVHFPHAKIKKIINKPGVIPWLSYLHNLVHEHDFINYGLLLEQDVETNDIGYLFLRRV